jgi:ABC-type phosphate/phosphonate transport system substrate-binding protein
MKIPTRIFLINKNLPKNLIKKIRQAFLNLKNIPEGKKILSSISKKTTGFLTTKDENYDSLREVLKYLNKK